MRRPRPAVNGGRPARRVDLDARAKLPHAGRPLRASGTSGRGAATLSMQDDRDLVLYPHAGGSPGASGTVRP
ncbi:hypothetical protein [Dactylosporangium sp. NPDC000521]|uniref:hypothetical protein n=1 Tax=Dactylosporangium sp. NPDC000521 TaxID=3363975 RepID=UPI0036981AA1